MEKPTKNPEYECKVCGETSKGYKHDHNPHLNQEPTRECCATGSLNCGMEGCKTCHSIKPPVDFEKILEKEEIRHILGEKAEIDYDRNYSHYHCWNQTQPPACGQKLEDHKQCCLCDTPYGTETSIGGAEFHALGELSPELSWEEEFDKLGIAVKYKQNNQEIVDFDYLKPQLEVIKDFIKKVEQQAFNSGRASMVEEVRSLISMYKSYFSPIGDEFNKGKHQAMNDLDEKLQALKNKETKE